MRTPRARWSPTSCPGLSRRRSRTGAARTPRFRYRDWPGRRRRSAGCHCPVYGARPFGARAGVQLPTPAAIATTRVTGDLGQQPRVDFLVGRRPLCLGPGQRVDLVIVRAARLRVQSVASRSTYRLVRLLVAHLPTGRGWHFRAARLAYSRPAATLTPQRHPGATLDECTGLRTLVGYDVVGAVL